VQNGTKRCCRCGIVKGRGEFYKNKGRPDGIQTICKTCTKAQNRAYKEQRPQFWREAASFGKLTDAQRARRADRARRWRDANPDRKRELGKRWRERNPALAREIGRRSQENRRARKLGQFIEAVDSLIVLELHDGACGICGGDVDPTAFDVDHIVPISVGGEHSYANTQPAHPVCNRRKWAFIDG
jgi:5-methylcytosine-specific restriction endonuclease McrA